MRLEQIDIESLCFSSKFAFDLIRGGMTIKVVVRDPHFIPTGTVGTH